MISVAEMLVRGFGIASVPTNRARALVICQRPEAYAPSRVREAAAYLLEQMDATEDEERLAFEAIVHAMDLRGASGTKRSRNGRAG